MPSPHRPSARTSVVLLAVLTPVFGGCLGPLPQPADAGGALVLPVGATYTSHRFREDGWTEPRTVQVGHANDLVLPDETGRPTSFAALVATTADVPFTYYVAVDPSGGCPRAAGREAPLFFEDEPEPRTVSRFTYYLRSDPGMVAHTVQRGTQGDLLLLLLAAWYQATPEGQDLSQGRFLAGASVDLSAESVRLTLPLDRVPGAPGVLKASFNFTDLATPSYPTEVAWSVENPDYPAHAFGDTRGRLVLERAGTPRLVARPDCGALPDFKEPRAEPKITANDSFPPVHELPEGYPIREAYEEADELEGVRQFKARHPTARMVRMQSTVSFRPEVHGNPAGVDVRTIEWHVVYAEPGSAHARMVRLDKEVYEPTGLRSGTTVRDLGAISVPPYPASPPQSRAPLISIDAGVELAREAGVEPRRVSWGEFRANDLHVPTWDLARYDPGYGSDPDATRVHLTFDAWTGWLAYTAVNPEETLGRYDVASLPQGFG